MKRVVWVCGALVLCACPMAPQVVEVPVIVEVPVLVEAPLTNLELLMASCPAFRRETVLAGIDVEERLRRIGATFSQELDRLDALPCGDLPPCRKCWVAILEWVYFRVTP